MNNRIPSVLLGIALLPVAASAEVPQNPRYIAFIFDDFRDHEPSWFILRTLTTETQGGVATGVITGLGATTQARRFYRVTVPLIRVSQSSKGVKACST